MGIGDYLWPFERRFQDIPCAREAGIAAFLGGPATGALAFMVTGNVKRAYYATTYSGFAYFWITFAVYRYQYNKAKRLSEQFKKAVETDKFE